MNDDDLHNDIYLTLVARYTALREAELAGPAALLTAPVVHDEVDEDFFARMAESGLFGNVAEEAAAWGARDHLHALALAGLLDTIPWPLPETPLFRIETAFRVFDQALAERVGLNRWLYRLARATALDGAQVAALEYERPVDLLSITLPLVDAVSQDADLRLYLAVMHEEASAGAFRDAWEHLTADPALLAAHLVQPPEERSALDRALHGFLAFLRLCDDLDAFVTREELPLLSRSVVLACHGVLFDRGSSPSGLAERLEAQVWAALGQGERWAREDFQSGGPQPGVWASLRQTRAAVGRRYGPADPALANTLPVAVSSLGLG